MRNDEASPTAKQRLTIGVVNASRRRRSETAPHNNDANAKSRR